MFRDTEVEQFYNRSGWRMFDAEALTPAVASYLHEEQALVAHLLGARARQIIEIGCGYGRFLPLAQRSGIVYHGFDLVGWLLDLALLSQPVVATTEVSLHRAGAQRVGDLCRGSSGDLIVLPFNLFGNIPDPIALVRSLAQTGMRIVVSTFDPGENSTAVRRTYYEACGYRPTAIAETASGTLVRASQGLCSYAYRPGYLREMFARHGLRLHSEHALAGVGRAMLFTPPSPPAPSPPVIHNSAAPPRAWRVSAGEDLRLWSIDTRDNQTPLWRFKPTSARSVGRVQQRLHVQSSEPVALGLVKVDNAAGEACAGIVETRSHAEGIWRSSVALRAAAHVQPQREVEACVI